MGIFDNLFNKKNNHENGVFYRANLFQKNVASQIESDSLEIAISFHHSLVSIDEKTFKVKTLNSKDFNFPIRFSEKDSFTTTNIGKFENGNEFRLIQPIGLSLDMAKSKNNALGGFTLGSLNPNGWAVHFFLTHKDDIRQTNVLSKGSDEQIQKLIQGSMMGIKFGLPNKFIEFSKRLLPMIANNPSQLYDFDESEEFIHIMKSNLEVYDLNERNIINKI
ncbi:hypothetical protein [uncultured Lutibacter sp.]|uniref:hypothetical protein n=1 Tax=uncultured Lutibacter sp. TaxID=437739 RepID=UPI002616C5CA|nr:hypothetical protein [uncultured Lutibacter sp.]